MKTKSPQEKKALSYAKDRRNTYGSNDKASRITIPRRKAAVNKAYRHEVNAVLKKPENLADAEEIGNLTDAVRSVGRNDWKKWPDAPLGEVVSSKIQERADHAGRGKSLRKAAREFKEALRVEVMETDSGWVARAADHQHLFAVSEDRDAAVESLRRIAEAAWLNDRGHSISMDMDGEYVSPSLLK